MRERPILFSGPMVRALLAGTKTQTRRAVKHQWPYLLQEPHYATGKVLTGLSRQPGAWMEFRHRQQDEPGYQGSPASTLVLCPYGQPGDRLWVRETWQGPLLPSDEWEQHCNDAPDELPARFQTPAYCEYAADGGPPPEFMTADDDLVCRWKPSIHMPRWASRLTLEITGVRVERLQEISEADALAEGIVHLKDGGFGLPAGEHYHCADPRQSYLSLWEAINGPGSVEANPWVWVVEFKRLDTPAA